MIAHHSSTPLLLSLYNTARAVERALLNIAPRPQPHSLVVVPLSQPGSPSAKACMLLAKLGGKKVTHLPVLHKEGVRPGGREGCVSFSSERKVEVK